MLAYRPWPGEKLMRLRPIGNYVVVRPATLAETLPSGLYRGNQEQNKTRSGKVIAVGPGVRQENGTFRPLDIQLGDVVLFNRWGGEEDGRGEDKVVLLKSDDILCVIEE
jgi:chaperonin GroES